MEMLNIILDNGNMKKDKLCVSYDEINYIFAHLVYHLKY